MGKLFFKSKIEIMKNSSQKIVSFFFFFETKDKLYWIRHGEAHISLDMRYNMWGYMS
jgi:hypothetical protein